MAGYTTFTLYWEQWGGYPDRPYPFGNPTLTWVVASPEHAACCAVTSTSRGSTEVSWGAEWRPVARRLIDPLPALLDDVGAFGAPAHLVDDAADGDYRVVWALTGVSGDRPFHLEVAFTCPGERWTPLGMRLRDALRALGSAGDG
jgi:hypothetical protein